MHLPPFSPMLIFFILLLIVPVRLAPSQLRWLAFFIWLAGGLTMMLYGVIRLNEAAATSPMGTGLFAAAIAVSLILGAFKGKFILGKTSDRNVQRINEMTEPQMARCVYSVRSWIVIVLMITIGVSLNLGLIPLPLFWRGVINMGIGMGLIVSSIRYLNTPRAITE